MCEQIKVYIVYIQASVRWVCDSHSNLGVGSLPLPYIKHTKWKIQILLGTFPYHSPMWGRMKRSEK